MRKDRWSPTIQLHAAWPLLLSTALVAACADPPPAEAPAAGLAVHASALTATATSKLPSLSQTVAFSWTDKAVRTALHTPQAELTAAAKQPDVFQPRFLRRVAQRFAREQGGVHPKTKPLATSLLRDLQGTPTALAVLYPKGKLELTPQQLAVGIANRSKAVIEALKAGKLEVARRRFAKLQGAGLFQTVMVGARPDLAPLLSLSDGLPPQVYMRVGRLRVKAALKAAKAEPWPVRAFYEPAMGHDMRLGILYDATPKPPTQTKLVVDSGKESPPPVANLVAEPKGGLQVVWLLPSRMFPMGKVMLRKVYEAEVKKALAAKTDAGDPNQIVVKPTSPQTLVKTTAAALQKGGAVDPWAGLAASMGYRESKEFCSSCTTVHSARLDPAITKLIANDFKVLGAQDGECDVCKKVYESGAQVSVGSCDGALETCCDPDDMGDGNDCLLRCECTGCEKTTTTTYDRGYLIRGVPTFYQHDVQDQKTCGDVVAVGCVPLGVAEMMSWYDALGVHKVGNPYRVPGGIAWQWMAQDLRDNYMDATCKDGSTATSVTTDKVAPGIHAFLAGHGLLPPPLGTDYTLTTLRVDKNNEYTAWSQVKSEISAGRPVFIGYCASNTCRNLDDPNHLGLLTGYYAKDGVRTIYINTGWGAGDNHKRTWRMGDDEFYLYFLRFTDDAFAGPAWCPADSLQLSFTPVADIDYTCSEQRYGGYPVKKEIQADVCDVLADRTTIVRDLRWDETLRCITPKDIERLHQAAEEYGDFDFDPCWEYADGSDCEPPGI